MAKFRPTAALTGLISAVAVSVGAFSGSAVARPVPAASGTASPPAASVSPAPKATPAAAAGLAVLRVAVTRHYGQRANASGYSVIIATGVRQAWALGGTDPGGPSTPVAALWNGTTLTSSALPRGLTGFISDASAPSRSDVWAASQYGRYVLHWDGKGWRVARQWRQGQITGLTAISGSDVWTFGTPVGEPSALGTWHFDGTAWRRVPGLAQSIYRASAVSHSDIWAISANPGAGQIMRYDGQLWRPERTGQVLAGVQPRDILAVSNRDVWVVGNQIGKDGSPYLVLAHWDGARWSRLVSGLPAWAGRLAPGPHGDVLVTATPANAAAIGLILHASAHGWGATIAVRSGLGSGVTDVALAPGTGSLWATGGILTRLGGDAAIWTGPLARADRPPDDDI
jgi:hypothetical protein